MPPEHIESSPDTPRPPRFTEPVRALRRCRCGELVRDGEQHDCSVAELQESGQ